MPDTAKLNDPWHVENLLRKIYNLNHTCDLSAKEIMARLSGEGVSYVDMARALVTVACEFNWRRP